MLSVVSKHTAAMDHTGNYMINENYAIHNIWLTDIL